MPNVSPTPWSTHSVTARDYQHDIQVYDPETYISKLPNSFDGTVPVAKRQRVDAFDASLWTSQPPHVYGSYMATASQMVSPSTSMSSEPSQGSLTSNEVMSRQSSVTTSMTDAFDMMRVESSYSSCSADFPFAFDQSLDASFLSSITEKSESGRLAATGSDEVSRNEQQLLSSVGYGFIGQDFPFTVSLPPANVSPAQDDAAIGAGYSHGQAHDMQRTDSEQSTCSTSSAEIKACLLYTSPSPRD